jgi:hypothetical protein
MYQDIFFLEPDSFYHGRTNSTHCTLRTTRAACGPATPLADGSRSSLLNLDQLPGVGGRSCCQCGAFQGFHAAVGREARGSRSSRSDAAASGLVRADTPGLALSHHQPWSARRRPHGRADACRAMQPPGADGGGHRRRRGRRAAVHWQQGTGLATRRR